MNEHEGFTSSQKTTFVEIPPDYLGNITRGSNIGGDERMTLYFSANRFVRKYFWLRLKLIKELIELLDVSREVCLDFGGGGGVFLPTLSRLFKSVVSIDLDTFEAEKIARDFNLGNARVVQGNILTMSLSTAPFDAIIAADVLEHFRSLEEPMARIREWLKPHGFLFTSLPTESMLYVALRKVMGKTKPEDHYHTAYSVERTLVDQGFVRIAQRCSPLRMNVLPLFLVSAWKKGGKAAP